MHGQENLEISSLHLESAKKQEKHSFIESLKDDQFFFSNAELLKSLGNNELSYLEKDAKLKEIETMYDSYNLLKEYKFKLRYGNVLTSRKKTSNSVSKIKMISAEKETKEDEKKKSMAFKNTKEKAKELNEMKSRLSNIQESRKSFINQISKLVGPKKSNE